MQQDFEAYIQSVIRSQLAKLLKELLEGLSDAPVLQQTQAPVRYPQPISEGQTVKYRQGRGEFAARVVKVQDHEAIIERVKDGKRITRPVWKLYG